MLRGHRPLLSISIHALREEGDLAIRAFGGYDNISIHALREEGDQRRRAARRARQISIHALREEGDSTPARRRSWLIYFYPRPPRGGRRILMNSNNQMIQFLSTPSARRATILAIGEGITTREFLSTPSARRATPHHRGQRPREAISIHALREEGDSKNRDKISIFL